LQTMTTAMKDGEPDVRATIAQSVMYLNASTFQSYQDYVNGSVSLLKDDRSAVRLMAAAALGAVGKHAAAVGANTTIAKQALEDAAKDEKDPVVQQAAKDAIKQFPAQPAGAPGSSKPVN
jgi:hypothetical protein